jgi:NAD+ synthase (glutamine-hydrolysing)
LDKILAGYIEDDLTADELIRAGLPQDAVDLTLKLVNRNEYKRRQAPVGIKVTPRAFGRDRRMPITGRF